MTGQPEVTAAPGRGELGLTVTRGPGDGWDALLGAGDMYQGRRWLEVEERIDGGADGVVTLADAGGLRGGCALFHNTEGRGGSPLGTVRGALGAVPASEGDGAARLRDAAARAEPSVVLGSRRPGYSGVVGALPEADLARVVETAEAWARERGAASVGLPYVDEGDVPLRAALTARGFAEVDGFRCARLDLTGTTFEDYLAALPPRRARKIAAEDQALQAEGLRCTVEPLAPRLIDEIVPLELAVYAKYGTVFEEHAVRGLHHAVREVFATSARVVSGWLDGRRCGFAVAIAHGDALYCRQVGFDYGRIGPLPVYFGVVFYAFVRHAYETGARRIVYGIGSEQAKRLRGCTLVGQKTCWKLLGPHAAAPQDPPTRPPSTGSEP